MTLNTMAILTRGGLEGRACVMHRWKNFQITDFDQLKFSGLWSIEITGVGTVFPVSLDILPDNPRM